MSAPQIALVTGAAAGIGAGIAGALASSGYSVALIDLAADALDSTRDALQSAGGSALAVPTDVTDPDQVRAALDTVRHDLGVPTAVFTAAGVMTVSPFLELPLATWRRTLEINLNGTFIVLQACARAMVEDKRTGAMVAVASVAARGPRPDAADYAASKAGVVSLVQSAAVALGPHGIRVNAICPGVVDTAMTRRNTERRAEREGTTPEQVLEALVQGVPLGRAAQTGEIADVALALLGDGFGYVTGQAVNVCGGLEFN